MGFDLYAGIHAIAGEARISGLTQWADGLEDKFSIAMPSLEAHMNARWELEQLVVSLGEAEPVLSHHAAQLVDEITRAIA